MAPHLDLNVIVVGRDGFTPDKLQQVEDSLAIMKGIFATHGPEIGTVLRFHIDVRDAGHLVVIRSRSDVTELTNRWAVPNAALDLFVVDQITAEFSGTSPLPGRCPKRATKGKRAPVVSLRGDKAFSGNTFAHEVAHCLGLKHCELIPSICGPANFMATDPGANTGVTEAQATRMKTHCFVSP
ncbi:hypothetical protein SAMN05216371_8138 [Streptomyces sp. TLI_053]|uniref:hypothetical protein n=1 Tax=Streptomyces sp. TLI_053 TaxID=1855352 RepID=UPI00087C6770|nr:hypothetical protein [Streptomyces sp. TLI_053]SDT83318.1 hypothetical protein SAMN05216371_8138 [Streptomyces sp. TLI_053]